MTLSTRITRIAPECVRIQIQIEGSPDVSGSALNRYGFIFEEELKREGTPELLIDEKERGRSILKAWNKTGRELFRLSSVEFSPKGAYARFALFDEEEDWVGFGDQTRKRLFHRGFEANCQMSNVTSYVPVPMFMSTRGYAILVNTTHDIRFDMGCSNPSEFSWLDRSGYIDFYVWCGADFKELIAAYTKLTGRPELPPKWSFGLWFICRTQANDAEVMNDARLFREYGIPCDVIGLEPGWMEEPYDFSTQKDWSKERFPLPAWQKKCEHTWIKALKRMGYKLELWLCNDYDLSFEEERRRKAAHEQENCKDAVFCEEAEYDEHFTKPLFADKLTVPEEPWFKHLEQFVEWGADFFKQDGANQVCQHPDRVWRGANMADSEMHNLYPLLYSRQMNEGFANFTHRRPLVFTVSGWTGFQHYCGTWTGDTGGRIETLGAMLNTSCVGHSWCTNDMEVAQPEGIHFGYLLPWSQINSWTYFRMPWLQGRRLLTMHQEYARLRSRLIPYLYSCARQSTLTGLPMLMPLAIEFQKDATCRNILHEYLLGSAFLVTIYQHSIYLPEGEWKDFWNGKVYQGHTAIEDYQWPENRGGGLFLRSGAIVPLGTVMEYTGERAVDELELLIFPGKADHADFGYYEDDGVSFGYRDGAFALSHISLDKTKNGWLIAIEADEHSAVTKWSLRICLSAKPSRILNNGEPISGNFNQERQELLLKNVTAGKVEILP